MAGRRGLDEADLETGQGQRGGLRQCRFRAGFVGCPRLLELSPAVGQAEFGILLSDEEHRKLAWSKSWIRCYEYIAFPA
jgi:hypothetical protein